MKTKPIIAILLLCASISSIANPRVENIPSTVVVISNYNKLSVGKNISVVFVRMLDSAAVIRGSNKSLSKVHIKVVKGTLFITAKRNAHLSSATIYLPVKDLAEIRLQQNAKIHNGAIMDLIVYFNNNCYASLVIRGNVEYKALRETELEIERHFSNSIK